MSASDTGVFCSSPARYGQRSNGPIYNYGKDAYCLLQSTPDYEEWRGATCAEYEEFSALITQIRNEKGTESSSQGTKQSARKRIVKEKEVEEEGKEEKRKRNVLSNDVS